MPAGGKAESASDERTSLRSASTGPKPMYLAPRTNSIRQVRFLIN